MKEQIQKAFALAKKAHVGQVDSEKLPYITHPLTVALYVESEEEKIVALLHDTVEDTDVTVEQIRSEFGDKIADAVALMTHKDGVEYFDYVRKIKENPLARAVKMADLTHNMDISRVKNPGPKDYARVEKYKKAMEILEG